MYLNEEEDVFWALSQLMVNEKYSMHGKNDNYYYIVHPINNFSLSIELLSLTGRAAKTFFALYDSLLVKRVTGVLEYKNRD